MIQRPEIRFRVPSLEEGFYHRRVKHGAISFRPLARSDLPLLHRWLQEPHITPWWGAPPNFAEIEGKYHPRIEGTEPTHIFIISHETAPMGLIQWYRWSDYPQHATQLGVTSSGSAGIDLAFGEREMTGRGLGVKAIAAFLSQIVFADPSVTEVVCDVDEMNRRSLRAFEAAGFQAGHSVRLRGETRLRRVLRRSRSTGGEKV